MDLAAHQRALLALLEGGQPDLSGAADRAYLQEVAASDGLRVLREIVASWEAYDVRRSCPLTTVALEQSERFDATVASVRFEGTTAYLDARRDAFLAEVARTETGTLASVASFERALFAVRAGDLTRYVIEWDRDPAVMINGLLERRWLHESAPAGRFRTVVAADIPGYVAVQPAGAAAAS